MKAKLTLLLLSVLCTLIISAQQTITAPYNTVMTLSGQNPDVKNMKTLNLKGKEVAVIVGKNLHNANPFPSGQSIQFNNIIGITADDVDYMAGGVSADLYDVTADDNGILYVLGDMPYVGKYDGVQWKQIPLLTDTIPQRIEYVGNNPVAASKQFLVSGPMHYINGTGVEGLALITVKNDSITEVTPFNLPQTSLGYRMSATEDKIFISCHNLHGKTFFSFNKHSLSLDTTLPQPPTNTLFNCEAHDNTVYAFGLEASPYSSGLWKFDGTTWTMITSYPAGSGSALKYYNGTLYISGWFDTGGNNQNYRESDGTLDYNSGAPALRAIAVLNGNLLGVSDGGGIFATKSLFSGIKDIQADKLTIYPNPANNFVTVTSPRDAEIQLTDISGRILFTGTINATTTINTENIPSGMYFLNKQVLILQK